MRINGNSPSNSNSIAMQEATQKGNAPARMQAAQGQP